MENVRHQWTNLMLLIEERPKAIIAFLSSILALIIFCLFILPFLQQNIRNQEVQSTIYTEMTSAKVKGLPVDHLEQSLASKKSKVVVFFDPNSKSGQRVLRLLSDPKQLKQLAGTVYLYPLIYDKRAVVTTYNLPNNPVAISFKDGQAGYRMDMNQPSYAALKEVFLPQLNSLILPS